MNFLGDILRCPRVLDAWGSGAERQRHSRESSDRRGSLHLGGKGPAHNSIPSNWCEPGHRRFVLQKVMLSPSSRRRQSRRGGDWTYAADGAGQVLWYCPPGGNIQVDRCGNRVALQKYFSKQGKPYPSEMFTFKAGDVPPSWIQVAAEADGEDEQESGGSAGVGGSERVRSLSPAVGKVRMSSL